MNTGLRGPFRGPGKAVGIASALFVVVALGFVGTLVWRQSASVSTLWEQARHYGWSVEWAWLAAALALATANLFLMADTWTRLFRGLGGEIRRGDAWRAWLVTNLGRYVPGKIWQLAGLTAYARQRGSSGGAALSSALVFQIVVLATGTGVALGTLGGRALGLNPGWATAAGAGAGLAMLGLVAQPRAASFAARVAGKWMGERAEASVPQRRDLVVAGAGLTAAWAVYGMGLWALLRGIGAAAHLGPIGATGVFAGSYVVGYLAVVVPGGLVVREGAMAGLLVATTSLPVAVAAVAAVAARLWVTASELIAVAAVARPLASARRDEEPEPKKTGGRGKRSR